MSRAYYMPTQRSNWKTPQKLYDKLDKEFNFLFDPCPPNPDFDGLDVEWSNSNFVNPPYGRPLLSWLQKGYTEFLNGKLSVFLVPARTDTIWFHTFVENAQEIRFIKGRLKFDDTKGSAPFPSMLVIFDPEAKSEFQRVIYWA